MNAELEITNLVLDTLSQIRHVLLEGGQKCVLARQNDLTSRIATNASWAEVLPQLPRQLVKPLGLTVLLLLLQILEIRSNGSAALPWLALVTLGLLRLSQPLQHLAQSFSELQAGRPLMADLLPLLELPLPQEEPSTLKRTNQLAWKRLQLQCTSLRYDRTRKLVLRKLDLSLYCGECVALVGASGSGKSSLAALLLGLLQPDGGEALLDGRRLGSRSMGAWKRQCTAVG